MSITSTQLNFFTANFGDTPNGLTGVQYKSAINYVDNSTSNSALVPTVDKHTPGEYTNTNLVATKFISVKNPHRDTTKEGVNLFCCSPQAINYSTNGSGEIIDARAYVKFFFSGVQYLKLTGSELTP